MRAATARLSGAGDDRKQRLPTQRRPIRSSELADAYLSDAVEPLGHDLHVGFHDGVAEPTEFLHVLFLHDLAELLLRDAKFLKQRRHGEERAEEGVALHA